MKKVEIEHIIELTKLIVEVLEIWRQGGEVTVEDLEKLKVDPNRIVRLLEARMSDE